MREAKADWAVFCAKALRRYEQIYQGRKGWTADKIDHALPVVGILRSKRPQEALNCIFEVLVGHLAALPKRNKRRANKIKDDVMAGLKVQGYFRPNTEKRLNFKHDNTDNIYWSMEAGKKVWCVRAPSWYFKNHKSSARKMGENRLLVDISGDFYPCLEEYLGWARDLLLNGSVSDAFIVRSSTCQRLPRGRQSRPN